MLDYPFVLVDYLNTLHNLSHTFIIAQQIMDALLKKFLPGVIPHYTIPHTMGALASANTYGVIPYLKNILDIMIPLLPNLRTDALKQAFAYGILK